MASEPQYLSQQLKMVALHLGAGSNSRSNATLTLAKQACESTFRMSFSIARKLKLDSGAVPKRGPMTAEEAVTKLVEKLENHPCANCGYGSNLNIDGEVECDASIMCDRQGLWGAVAALDGCKNPITLAKSIYDRQSHPRPLGLVQPNFLVGSGARAWMRRHRPDLMTKPGELVSSKSFKLYHKTKSEYDKKAIKRSKITNHDQPSISAASSSSCSRIISRSPSAESLEEPTEIQMTEPQLDTVGAVAVDCEDNYAAAVSSGGLLLKLKGRIGQAAIPGAGCWAQDKLAVTTSGVGEYLGCNMLAKQFHYKMLPVLKLPPIDRRDPQTKENNTAEVSEIRRITQECLEEYIKSPPLRNKDQTASMVALLAAQRARNGDIIVTFAHNNNSFCVGYMSRVDSEAKSYALTGQQPDIFVESYRLAMDEPHHRGPDLEDAVKDATGVGN